MFGLSPIALLAWAAFLAFFVGFASAMRARCGRRQEGEKETMTTEEKEEEDTEGGDISLARFRALIAGTPQPEVPSDLEALYEYFGIESTGSYAKSAVVRHVLDLMKAQIGPGAEEDIESLRRHLIYEHVVDGADLAPAAALIEHLRGVGAFVPSSDGVASNWPELVRLAMIHEQLAPDPTTSTGDLYRRLMNRHFNVAEAATRLAVLDGSIRPEGGRIILPDQAGEKIANEILDRIRRVGGGRMVSALLHSIQDDYDPEQRRYQLVRSVSQVPSIRPPRTPTVYLLNLAVRELEARGEQMSADEGQRVCDETLELATDLVAVLDVEEYSTWGRVLQRPRTLVRFLQQTVIYDSAFVLVQMNPDHVVPALRDLFAPFEDTEHRVAWGSSIDGTLDVVAAVLEVATASLSLGGRAFREQEIVERANVPREEVIAVLAVLTHDQPVNAGYLLPWDAGECDFQFRPLLPLDDTRILLADPSWCAPAFYEALAQAMRASGARNVEQRLGYDGVETLLRGALARAGVVVAHGTYGRRGNQRECDCATSSADEIFFFELKKKALTRKARGGDAASLVVDVAAGLLKAHNQCLKHELALRRDGELAIEDPDGNRSTLELAGRSVERVAVTLTDYFTLHDRQAAQHFLQAVASAEFSASSAAIEKRLEPLRKSQEELRKALQELRALGAPGQDQPFFHSTFMSIPQLLAILEDVSNAEELRTAMRHTRHMTMGTGDFLFEYKYVRDLKAREQS